MSAFGSSPRAPPSTELPKQGKQGSILHGKLLWHVSHSFQWPGLSQLRHDLSFYPFSLQICIAVLGFESNSSIFCSLGLLHGDWTHWLLVSWHTYEKLLINAATYVVGTTSEFGTHFVKQDTVTTILFEGSWCLGDWHCSIKVNLLEYNTFEASFFLT